MDLSPLIRKIWLDLTLLPPPDRRVYTPDGRYRGERGGKFNLKSKKFTYFKHIVSTISKSKSYVTSMWDKTILDFWTPPADTKDTISDKVKEVVKGGQIRKRTHHQTLRRILEDGYVKNQHLSKTSSGTYDPTTRIKAEMGAFGYEGGDLSGYPIYGYVCDPEGMRSTGFISIYGDVDIVLKSKVKERTTITFGDSLGSLPLLGSDGEKENYPDPFWLVYPQPIDQVDYLSVCPSDSHKVYKAKTQNIQEFLSDSEIEYIEAQVHGGITLADIEKVIIPRRITYDCKQMLMELTDRNIPYEVVDDDW